MYFDSVADFLAMGGHGPYVWSAYALSAVLIGGNMMLALRRQARVRAALARQARRARGPGAARNGMESSE